MKLKITARGCVDASTMEEQTRLSPDLPEPKGTGPLALVGGGLSLSEHLDELRQWPGEVWAVNQTAHWLRANGVPCFFFTVDPSETAAGHCSGRAIVHQHCNPQTFANAGECYKTTGSIPGPSTIVAGCALGIKAGYSKIYLFGADSSYGETSHVYRNEPVKELIQVQCGQPFLTRLELLLQAERLAEVVQTLPEFFENKSGGFLKALIDHGDYDVTHACKAIHERIKHG